MIDPCNNCKKCNQYCSIYTFIKNNIKKMSSWALSQSLDQLTSVASVISADPTKDNVKIECRNYEPIKQYVNYGSLVNSKPQPEDECDCLSSKSCATKGDKCGGCKP